MQTAAMPGANSTKAEPTGPTLAVVPSQQEMVIAGRLHARLMHPTDSPQAAGGPNRLNSGGLWSANDIVPLAEVRYRTESPWKKPTPAGTSSFWKEEHSKVSKKSMVLSL